MVVMIGPFINKKIKLRNMKEKYQREQIVVIEDSSPAFHTRRFDHPREGYH